MWRLLYILAGLATAVIGHHIHGSIFFALINWIFWPLAWLKWLLCHQVSISVIKGAFAFFLN